MPAPVECPVGMRFGQLTVLGEAPSRMANGRGYRQWRCRCDCGFWCDVSLVATRRGQTKMCRGCARAAKVALKTKHGGARKFGEERASNEYEIWSNIKKRCHNPTDKSYARYGAVGIRLCPEWHDFGKFLADMGPRPSKLHSVDRRDGALGYEPGNCYWATVQQQADNKKSNVWVTVGEQRLTIAGWARELGLPRSTVYGRVKRAGSPEAAITQLRSESRAAS